MLEFGDLRTLELDQTLLAEADTLTSMETSFKLVEGFLLFFKFGSVLVEGLHFCSEVVDCLVVVQRVVGGTCRFGVALEVITCVSLSQVCSGTMVIEFEARPVLHPALSLPVVCSFVKDLTVDPAGRSPRLHCCDLLPADNRSHVPAGRIGRVGLPLALVRPLINWGSDSILLIGHCLEDHVRGQAT
jgi:hypothetical protein